jgi:uncharacterized protein
MKQLLEYIIPNIVNHPEDVVITEEAGVDGNSYLISVNPEDMGRVIGKAGKVIKAIRQIAHIMAVKRGVRIHIDVLDKNEGIEPSETPVSESETTTPSTEEFIPESTETETVEPETTS